MSKNISLIVPTVPLDINNFLSCCELLFTYLPIKNIYLICDKEKISIQTINPKITIIDESSLINYSTINNLLISRVNDLRIQKRTGWYLQQFLKMSYARICQDDYYLLWDSDTVPLKNIRLFDENEKAYLDYKSEYHKPYFDTIRKLLPGYDKIFRGSFIAEHMLINTSHMCELLNLIESNDAVAGKYFYEKIINCIPLDHIYHSGFSEFETYGCFVYKKYKDQYTLRKWSSLRYGGLYFTSSDIKNSEIKLWLAKYYDAISFEKGHYLTSLNRLITSKILRKFLPSVFLEYISIPIRATRKYLSSQKNKKNY